MSDDTLVNIMDDDGGENYVFTSQDIAFAIVPKFAAVLSLLGSSCIIAEVVKDHRSNRGSKPICRLLLAMSVSDMFISVGWFLTTWASPADTPYTWQAAGTVGTCELQGFLHQLG